MREIHHNEETYSEMNLGEVLRELYRWKWQIFVATFLVGISTALYTLTMPNIYESSAALIIRTPPSAIAGGPKNPAADEATVLSVETLQTLAESTEVKRELFESLWENQTLERWKIESSDKQYAFRMFQGCLSTELKKKQGSAGRSVSLLPILVLEARAQSPVEAQALANEWVQLVETKSREVYTEGVEALNEFVGNMFNTSKITLASYEIELSSNTLKASLDLKKVRLQALKSKSTGLEEEIFDINTSLAVNTVAIKEGRRRIKEQQHDNQWIGAVAEAAFLSGIPSPFDQKSLSDQAKKVVKQIEQKMKLSKAFRDFRKQENPLGKEKLFEHYQLELPRILAEKAKVDDELPSMEAELEALSEQLRTTPEKITLDKAITDDALWNAHVDKSLPENSSFVPLKSEVLNPVYQSIRNSIVRAISRIGTLKGSAKQLAKSAESASFLIAEIESEMDVIQRESDRRQKELETVEATVRLLHEDYVSETTRVEEFVLMNIRKREELISREELREKIATEVDLLERDVSGFELEIAALTREVEKTKNVRQALASKAEEVALLQISAKLASNTGTAILYNAEANPLKMAPSRRKIVLSSMLVAFALSVLVACSAKMIRTAS